MEGRSTLAYSTERSMESNIASLQSDVKHMAGDIADIKSEVKGLRDRMEGLSRRIDSTKIWMLLIAGGLLAVLARSFKWI